MRRMLSRMSPLRMWLNSCATTPCNSSRGKRFQSAAGHSDDGVVRTASGGEGVDGGVGSQINLRRGDSGRDGHFVHDIDESALQRVAGGRRNESSAHRLGDGRAAAGFEREGFC